MSSAAAGGLRRSALEQAVEETATKALLAKWVGGPGYTKDPGKYAGWDGSVT